MSLEVEYYDMSKERKMIIFNHFKYNDCYPGMATREDKPSQRHGTEVDVRSLERTGENLNFDVQTHHDCTHDEILDIMDKLCKQSHSNTSCVCVCVLTHGWHGGELYARDRTFGLGDIVSKLQNHAPGLVGKPKLVFVQACRGGLVDAGKLVKLDGAGGAQRLPAHADTLVLSACVEDYSSFRNGRGSWLIQELCRVLDAKHRQLDLLQMIVITCRLVASERESRNDDSCLNNKKKQTAEFCSTLTKTLRFSDYANGGS